MTDLEHELRRIVEADVRFGTHSRLLYSTDALELADLIGDQLTRFPCGSPRIR